MKKTIIAIAFISLFYVSDSMAQGRRGSGQRTRMPQDTTQMLARGERLTAADLPAAVVSSIKKAYPDAQMKRISKNKQGNFNVVLTQTDQPRHLLVLSNAGEMMKDRKMPAKEDRKEKQR